MGPAAAYAPVASHDYGGHNGHDDTDTAINIANLDTSSPASTPSTTTTTTTPVLSRTDHSYTPLSLIDDSLRAEAEGESTGASSGLGAGSGAGSAKAAAGPAATDSPGHLQLPTATMSPASAVSARVAAIEQSEASAVPSDGNEALISPTARHGYATAPAKGHPQHELLTGAIPRHPVQAQPQEAHSANDTKSSSSASPPPTDFPPLRTGSVQPDTKIARPRPIIRTTSDATCLALQHPVPDLDARSGAYAGNIAQLEATAERLSMTSSIDDAIRDLHGELKRSDSRRSSTLARAASVSEEPLPVGLHRHLSNASSIISTNIAARHGGYSPAAYVMSPSDSLTSRLRSGSKGSSGRPELDVESVLSRHGPGKASVRSVRSTKMSLAEISESEPIALNKDAFDKADAAPPIDDDKDDTMRVAQQGHAEVPNTDAFHEMLGGGFAEQVNLDLGLGESRPDKQGDRPVSSRSNNTFQQLDPFIDFDGVHWEPAEDELYVPPHYEPEPPPAPRPVPVRRERPQSYFDPESGQQMLYYPARVPAMLNLPRKLGNKPKTTQRTQRRSQVLSAMVEVNRQSVIPDLNAESAQDMRHTEAADTSRNSWLPDPLAGHRESFAALSTYGDLAAPEERSGHGDPVSQPEPQPEAAPEALRRPQRLSRMDPDNRKSRMSRMDNLPSQLRASAFFDLPSDTPEIEVKDGSAMATLESILDASANAPVDAFTDHSYGGKLGPEVYGRERKRKSQAAAAALSPASPVQEPKKRSSFMWLNKRASSYNSEDKHGHKSTKSASALGPVNDVVESDERQALTSSIDGESVLRHDIDGPESERDGSVDENAYQGPPTTLLAELQLRKQQQKQRTQPLAQINPNGMHATLLEMDAVAETQRKTRQTKRVNLAWEDPDAHLDQNGSDDEDVPLAIIAAKHQGAKNVVDLERPLGLVELREIEENEPLSHRRARLQGIVTTPLTHHKRQSITMLTAPTRIGDRSPASRPASRQDMLAPEPFEEIEGETLGERRRRLQAKEEAELPKARPVSSSFSAELLSQFGDLDRNKEQAVDRTTPPNPEAEEETLGQRRRRLQAEREAREREMSYGNLVGRPPKLDRRMSLADVLPAHPKKDTALEERSRIEEQTRAVQQAKTLAARRQMPMAPGVGAFRGGVYNDGSGGIAAAQSTPAVHSQGLASPYRVNGYAAQQPYGAMSSYGGYNGMSQYGAGPALNVYGTGVMQPVMPVPAESMDRVERWRQSIQP